MGPLRRHARVSDDLATRNQGTSHNAVHPAIRVITERDCERIASVAWELYTTVVVIERQRDVGYVWRKSIRSDLGTAKLSCISLTAAPTS